MRATTIDNSAGGRPRMSFSTAYSSAEALRWPLATARALPVEAAPDVGAEGEPDVVVLGELTVASIAIDRRMFVKLPEMAHSAFRRAVGCAGHRQLRAARFRPMACRRRRRPRIGRPCGRGRDPAPAPSSRRQTALAFASALRAGVRAVDAGAGGMTNPSFRISQSALPAEQLLRSDK